ncbi:BrnT family toxin [Desulfobacterales bacterium HSG17]|nr:BrnT family toxin [Desulfobacterales bacterium HSG17]
MKEMNKEIVMNLTFEWDKDKSLKNSKKHKISFEEGKTVFNDPFLMKGRLMKNKIYEKQNDNDMLPEYDFSSMPGRVQGKYYKAYRKGHTVRIHNKDGEILTHFFTLKDGAVMLESDVRKYFQDSESVNKALRCLIPIIAGQERKVIKS